MLCSACRVKVRTSLSSPAENVEPCTRRVFCRSSGCRKASAESALKRAGLLVRAEAGMLLRAEAESMVDPQSILSMVDGGICDHHLIEQNDDMS